MDSPTVKRLSRVCHWCGIVMDEDGNALRAQTQDERDRFSLLGYAAAGLPEAYVCKDCAASDGFKAGLGYFASFPRGRLGGSPVVMPDTSDWTEDEREILAVSGDPEAYAPR